MCLCVCLCVCLWEGGILESGRVSINMERLSEKCIRSAEKALSNRHFEEVKLEKWKNI